MAIAKPADVGTDRGVVGRGLAGDWPILFPTVFEYLTEDRYADQSPREVSTLLLFVESGTAKLCLNDRDTGRTGWASGASVEEAMANLEDRLAKGGFEWKVSKGKGGGRKGK